MSAPRWEPDPAEIAAWVEASCSSQEIPAKVTDATTLDDLAHLLKCAEHEDFTSRA